MQLFQSAELCFEMHYEIEPCWCLIFIHRHSPSQADVTVFEGLGKAPNPQFAHAHRWYSHISSFGEAKSKFPSAKSGPPPKVEAKEEEDDDDEVDLFGSDDDEEEVCYFFISVIFVL